MLRTDLRAACGHSQSEAEPAHWAMAKDEGINPSIGNRMVQPAIVYLSVCLSVCLSGCPQSSCPTRASRC